MGLYTVSTAINKAKLLIEEAADTNIITENELITAVSDAQKWVAAESGCYQAWGTITLLANTVRYDPPASTSGVLGLQYNYGGELGWRNLLPVEPDAVPHPPDFLFPYYWHYRGNKVSIYPAMSELPASRDSSLANTVDILTVQIPAALTTLTAALVIPDEFQIVVPYYVAQLVAIKDNQAAKANLLLQEIQRLTKVGIAQYAHQPGRAQAGAEGAAS